MEVHEPLGLRRQDEQGPIVMRMTPFSELVFCGLYQRKELAVNQKGTEPVVVLLTRPGLVAGMAG
jgi:hypothetical protein